MQGASFVLFGVISWIVSSAAKRTIHEVTPTNTNFISQCRERLSIRE